MAKLEKLKEHLQVARVIIDERNLYGIWDYIPKSWDPDFRGNSFNEAVKQAWEPRVYENWSDDLEDIFLANNLDYLKFKRITVSGDARKTSNFPAALFIRRVRELERIFENPNVLESYKTKNKQPATWPRVTFKDGTVTQGARSHTFTQPIYTKLIKRLWKNRRIETPTGKELVKGRPVKRSALNNSVGFKDHQRFTDVATGIRKAMKSKGIALNVMYPDDVILVVKQSRK